MKRCEECGKKLGILEGYQHPTLGKKLLLCNPCFDQVSDSVAKWREFILSNSFIQNPDKNNFELDREKILRGFIPIRKMYDSIWAVNITQSNDNKRNF
jgi:hypothetical protein